MERDLFDYAHRPKGVEQITFAQNGIGGWHEPRILKSLTR